MELKVKVDGVEMPIEEAMSTGTDLGTSPYGFKFDGKCFNWDKVREVNVYYLKLTQDYLNDLLKHRGHLFLNEVYDRLGIPRRAIGQCVGWIYDENNPNGDNFVDLDIFNERNNNDKNAFILDPNVDGYILDKI